MGIHDNEYRARLKGKRNSETGSISAENLQWLARTDIRLRSELGPEGSRSEGLLGWGEALSRLVQALQIADESLG
jgi:hypothetical protein